MANIALWLVALAWPIAKKVLQVLGIGWVSYEGVTTLTNSVVQQAQANWGGMSGTSLQILSLAGMPEVLGVLTGALVARASFIVVEKLTKVATQ